MTITQTPIVERTDIKTFIRDYVKDIRSFNAAIFAGAGLSRPAGFVNWKELLSEIAEDLSLDIDKETDLVEIAQFHVNEHQGRHKINQKLIDEFIKGVQLTVNHKILASLPIETYWTTNYDPCIEQSLKEASKVPEVKITKEDFPLTIRNRNAIIYKMHGDIQTPSKAILTKDDYEKYNETRLVFTEALKGDLLTKTFLFIGISFDDPNLEYILSRIRILLGENQRQHYCFWKEISKADYSTEKEFNYEHNKQKLKINDLKRFGINVLLLNDYSEITLILEKIKSLLKRNNIFISGAVSDYGDWGQERINNFTQLLTKALIQNANINIVTGFGLNIGSYVISKVIEELYSTKQSKIEDRLLIRPFPQTISDPIQRKKLWKEYRQDMLSNVGIAIFIFGNKYDVESSQLVESNGMIEEFEIAVENKVVPIPIGVTNYAAKTLWDRVMKDFSTFVPNNNLQSFYQNLGDSQKTDTEIISITMNIIEQLSK